MLACPKGWRLPTSEESNDNSSWDSSSVGLSKLVDNIAESLIAEPYLFNTGGINDNGFNYYNQFGRYWSATQANSSFAYSLNIDPSNGLQRLSIGKRLGLTVRCIADPYIQNFNAGSLAVGQVAILKDKRDNNDYIVKKLKDEKVWMVQNLRLVGPRTLTPSDSNIASNFNIPASAGSSGWCTDNSEACVNQTLVYYDPATRYSYGALYNSYAATAGGINYATIATNTITSSICPSGWRLPTGGADGDFTSLDKALGGSGENRSYANTFSVLIGDFMTGDNAGFDYPGGGTSSITTNTGADGRWATSTMVNSWNVYGLYMEGPVHRLDPQNSQGTKVTARAIRCIAQ